MRYASGLVAIIVLLVILVWALLRANAAWHFFAAQAIAEPLFDTGKVTVTAFEESESHLDIALRRFPNNPDYLDFSGRLMLLQANQIGVMGLERRELLESAADNFRQAISVRPLWPYSWANLLATKDKQGQVDMEFNRALPSWAPGSRACNCGLFSQVCAIGANLAQLSNGLCRARSTMR